MWRGGKGTARGGVSVSCSKLGTVRGPPTSRQQPAVKQAANTTLPPHHRAAIHATNFLPRLCPYVCGVCMFVAQS